MKTLTDTAIRAVLAKARPRRVDLVDGTVPGLALRVGKKRGATWSLLFRVVGEGGATDRGHSLKGEKSRVTLGKYPALSIAGARALANAYMDQASKGVNPTAALEVAATPGGLTVEELAVKFIDDYVRMKELRALSKYQSAVRVHIVPDIGEVLADVLSRQQLRTLMMKVLVKAKAALSTLN